jgi:hypothetical protein
VSAPPSMGFATVPCASSLVLSTPSAMVARP